MMALRTVLRRALPLGALVAVMLSIVGSAAVARAAGGATFQDGAHLFTQQGKDRIQQVAHDANIRVLVLTTTQAFSGKTAFQRYVRSQSSDRGGITIALYPPQRYTYALVGPDSGLSPSQASQGIQQARANLDAGHWTNGVVQMIQYYQSVGASSPGGSTGSPSPAPSPSSGISIGGILIPLIILAVLAFLLFRVLGRRRNVGPGFGPGYGPGPYNQGPYQGGYGPGYGNQGGGSGLGRGFLGGLAGGVAGSFIGNELFGNRGGGGGTANAAGPDTGTAGGDANAAPGDPYDTASSQQYQGDWGGDSGGWGNSGADAGGVGGGDSGGGWGGDSGGGGGGDSGGWGGDSGGGGDSGSWT